MNRWIVSVLSLLLFISVQAQDSLLYHILQVEEYLNQQKDSAALKILNQYPKENYYYYFLKGKTLLNLSNKKEALAAFKNSNNLQAKYADLNIAEIYANTNQSDSAFLYLKSYLSKPYKVSYGVIYNKESFSKIKNTAQWTLFWEKDFYTEEEKTLQQAIFFNSKKEILTALDILDELINKNKKNAYAYYYRALFTVNLNNDYKGAIKDLLKALKIEADNYDFNILCGKYYLRTYKYKKALIYFLKANNIFPYKLENYYYLSESFYREGDYSQAENYILYYLKVKPLSKKAIFLAGNIYLDDNKDTTAISIFTKGVYQYPRDLRFVMGRGKAYMQNKEYQKAARDFNTAIDLNAQNGELWFLKAMAVFYQNQKQKACKLWKKARFLNYYQADEYLLKYCN